MAEASTNRDALRLEGVTKRFGAKVAVDGLSFRVPRGSVFGFIGPNGAGKTTTIRMALDILRPDEGQIAILGQPLSARLKDRIGYMPEERGLYKKMRVGDTLRYFGALKGASPRALAGCIPRWLERFDMRDWEGRRIEELSNGMQQKVQFVACVVHEPDLLILDEAFAGLDPINTAAVKDALLDLKREGRTIVFSTHVMEMAEKLCDEILMIDRGRKALEGPLEAILAQHGENIAVLEYEGDGSVIRAIPGVESVNDYGNYVEVKMADGADPQALLRALIDQARIRRFETRRSSLTEIFLRLAGRGGDE